MSEIKSNVEQILSGLPEGVCLVAVSKTKTIENILEAYNFGQRIFAENRVQELIAKKDFLPYDIQWHLIGHLQTNKVKYIAPFISMIQSVDSLKLLSLINSEAKKLGRTIDCLLQFHIAEEENKFGFLFNEAVEAISSIEYKEMKNIRIRGLMGIATFTNDEQQIRKEFRSLYANYLKIKEMFFFDNNSFSVLSMGMSDDYSIAIEEGSNMVRIGSKIFGVRK